MSTFKVNTTLDSVAVDLQTGKDATGHISLRSAIMAADASGGSSTIKLRNGTYKLTLDGVNKDQQAPTGDLDLQGNITIKGAGSRGTIIDGNNIDRVIHVSAGNVKISGVTIEHGMANMGGGLLNTGGQVSLSSVVIANNRAVGAIIAKESFASDAVLAAGPGSNGADGTAGLGGGIYNGAGSLNISKSTISGNQAQGSDGGRGGDGGAVRGVSQAGANGQDVIGASGGDGGSGAAAFGGGIYNAKGANLTISGTVISSDVALGGPGRPGGDRRRRHRRRRGRHGGATRDWWTRYGRRCGHRG